MISVTNFILDEFDLNSIKTHIINAFRLPRIPHLSPEEEKLAIGKIKKLMNQFKNHEIDEETFKNRARAIVKPYFDNSE